MISLSERVAASEPGVKRTGWRLAWGSRNNSCTAEAGRDSIHTERRTGRRDTHERSRTMR